MSRQYRIAFYAPLKPPHHPIPSGDRQIGRLLIAALLAEGHTVELASGFRSFDGGGDPRRQARIESVGRRLGQRLLRRYNRMDSAAVTANQTLPDCWLTYHSYHKAPDWIGLEVAAALGIPYLVAEASVASTQADGAWTRGHAQAIQVARHAHRVLEINSADSAGVRTARGSADDIVRLPLFLDPEPYSRPEHHRDTLAVRHALDSAVPWLFCAAMMRGGRKLRSFQILAEALGIVGKQPWLLLVAGAGPEIAAVRSAFSASGVSNRVHFLGLLNESEMIDWMHASDWFVWPAFNEPLGMAMLEAQAAGLPVIAGHGRGVGDIVRDGQSGWLVKTHPAAIAQAIQRALTHPTMQTTMSRQAYDYVRSVHGIKAAGKRLTTTLEELCG